MAQAARNPCVANITSHASRLAPPSSQKSAKRVVSARGGADSAEGRNSRPSAGIESGCETVEVVASVTRTLYGTAPHCGAANFRQGSGGGFGTTQPATAG